MGLESSTRVDPKDEWEHLAWAVKVLPLSLKASIYRNRINQTFKVNQLYRKNINIYDKKWVSYKNIFYDKFNVTNLVL